MVDEIAYVPRELVFSTLLPQIVEEGVCLFGISTPREERHWFSTIGEKVDDYGVPIALHMKPRILCEECEKLHASEAAKCTHNSYMNPTWHDSAMTIKIRKLMDSEMVLQDMFGVPQVTSIGLFSSEKVMQATDMDPTMNVTKEVPTIFMGIDPSGGKCTTGIVAMTLHQGIYKVRYNPSLLFFFCPVEPVLCLVALLLLRGRLLFVHHQILGRQHQPL